MAPLREALWLSFMLEHVGTGRVLPNLRGAGPDKLGPGRPRGYRPALAA